MRIRDGDSSDPGWKKVGSGMNIPDPQHSDKVVKLVSDYLCSVQYITSYAEVFYPGSRVKKIPAASKN